ncbi:MAG: hypothetical protein RI895_104 [Actinomycetota bacterium]|jgi:hypothetical protein
MLRFLKRRQFARSISDEAGATTAIFAIVVLVGVMAGTFALVVDAGQLFLERRVVQNVADASAGYLTQSCATGGICAPTIPSSYTENNSPDSNTEIIEICGTPEGFDPCTDLVGDIRDCLTPTTALADSNFVRVRSQTLTISNKSALSPTFARLFGASSDDGNWTIRGCSQGIWGGPSSMKVTTPLAISICNWEPPTSSSVGTPKVVLPWSLSASGPCSIVDLNGKLFSKAGTHKGVAPVSIPGMDLNCIEGTTLSVGEKIIYANGASAPKLLCDGIGRKLKSLITAAEPIYIPIYGASENVNGNLELTVISFVRFKLTAYTVNPPLSTGCKSSNNCDVNWDSENPIFDPADPLYGGTTWVDADAACNGKDLCVAGEFLEGTPPSGNISGGSDAPSLGPLAFNLIP